MPLSIIGTPAAVAASTITLPTHAIGDVIILCAYTYVNNTPPTKPTAGGTVPAWVDIDANTGTFSNSMRTVYFVATATNHTSGTWSDTIFLGAIVLRGQGSPPVGGHADGGGFTGSSIAPAVTMTRTDGSSVLIHFHGGELADPWAAAPAGYTRRASAVSGGAGLCFNTKDTTTSDGSVVQAFGGGGQGNRGATVEILAPGAPQRPSVFINQAVNRASFY